MHTKSSVRLMHQSLLLSLFFSLGLDICVHNDYWREKRALAECFFALHACMSMGTCTCLPACPWVHVHVSTGLKFILSHSLYVAMHLGSELSH